MHIYLDNAATTKPKKEVLIAMSECLDNVYGNPSSAHIMGIKAEKVIKKTRNIVADVLGVKASEIIFTSGGTESNNLAIKGVARARQAQGRHIITSAIEHPSVLKSCLDLADEGFQLTVLGVNEEGYINIDELRREIRPDTILVSIMHVNNETGVIQSVEDIGQLIKEKNHKTLFHVDAVQSFGKLNVSPRNWKADLLSLSGHKIHGPKGIGALFVKSGIRIEPILSGGGQESELRSGTENVPGIAGLGAALECSIDCAAETENHLFFLKELMKKKLLADISDIKINSPVKGAGHILNVSFRGVRGEVLLHTLEGENIYVSTGSACSSKKFIASGVLSALGLNKTELEGSVRFSFSKENTQEEIDITVTKTANAVREIRKYARRSR